MKRRIGKYIINTHLITHIYKEDEEVMYSTNSSQYTWITSSDLHNPETIFICFGECFLRFYKGYDKGYNEALELYKEFENEAELQNT